MDKLSVVTAEVAAEVKSKNPSLPLRICRYETAEVIIRPAPAAVYRRFLDDITDKDRRAGASGPLVFACVVWPPEKDLTAIIEARPGLVSSIADDAAEFSGVKAASEKKDL